MDDNLAAQALSATVVGFPAPRMYPRLHLLGLPQELRDLVYEQVFPRTGGMTENAKTASPEDAPIEIDPPTQQVYPRLHFLGLPREIRDQIYAHALGSIEVNGAANCQPLLTCRQIWHEAHELTFATTIFDASILSAEQIISLHENVPASLIKRKIGGLRVFCNQIRLLSQHMDGLPPIEVLQIAAGGRNDGAQNTTIEWENAIIDCTLLRGKFRLFTMSSKGFTQQVRESVTLHNMMCRYAVLQVQVAAKCTYPMMKITFEDDENPRLARYECLLEGASVLSSLLLVFVDDDV